MQKRSSPGKSASSSGPEHGSTSSSGQAGLSTGLPPGQSAGQAGQGGLPGMGSEAASDSDDFEPDFLVVGEMSRIGRGMHTTTSAQLMRLKGGGKLADTPGFSQPTLERIESTQLAAYFPEFVARMERQPCRFNDCKHLAEPGCSITGISSEDAASLFEAPSAAELDLLALSPEMLEALEEGMMDSDALRVQSDAATAQGFWRYRYYLKFLEEIMKQLGSHSITHPYTSSQDRENRDVKFKQVARREREGQAKVKHGKGGKQRLEAMLNNKKHRGSARQRDGRATRESLDSFPPSSSLVRPQALLAQLQTPVGSALRTLTIGDCSEVFDLLQTVTVSSECTCLVPLSSSLHSQVTARGDILESIGELFRAGLL
eukprot:gene28780-31967_t